MRGGARPRIAVVRRSKDDRWVLPRGKLKRDENPIAGAKREAVEETGHRVQVHEFLGAITYSARGRPKLVQFWRMLAAERPSYDLTEDITEVRWLPLSAAIRRLSFPLEKLFLRSVGRALRRRRQRRKPRRQVGAQVRAQRHASASCSHAKEIAGEAFAQETPSSAASGRARRAAPRRACGDGAPCRRTRGDRTGRRRAAQPLPPPAGPRRNPALARPVRNLMRAPNGKSPFQNGPFIVHPRQKAEPADHATRFPVG